MSNEWKENMVRNYCVCLVTLKKIFGNEFKKQNYQKNLSNCRQEKKGLKSQVTISAICSG